MKNNGRAKKVEDVVEAVMDALQERSEGAQDDVEAAVQSATGTAGEKLSDAGAVVAEKAGVAGEKIKEATETASEKIKDADVGAKVDRILDLIEENAAVFAAVAKRVTGDAAKQAPAVAAAVGEAAGDAAEAAGEAAGEAASAIGEAAGSVIETIGEELVEPATRYGRGLRHGLVVGAVIAILVTPWPGSVVREKLKAAAQEASDLINALREGADSSSF